MGSNKAFEIPFEGLKNGEHDFKFEITDAFFEELTYSIIDGADVVVDFTLTKKETMLLGLFEMKGKVKTACDRCTDSMEVSVEVSHQMIYKFDEEESGDENLISIPKSAHSINIADDIYELLTVALPNRAVHPSGECNKEMLKLIEKYVSSNSSEEEIESKTIDPRWDALKKLN